MTDHRLRRFGPVLLLAAIELVWCAWLAASRTIPGGHDGFQYFYLKYYFFNDYIEHGELAQWLPYLTHGSPAEWWYVVQTGIFDPIVMGLARVLAIQQFLPLFYTLIFLDKALLIAGAWLLAGEHLRRESVRFAVTAAVTFSAIWMTQAWWNLHVFVALPMLLYFVHRAMATAGWRWLSAAFLLLFLQSFGNLTYVLPITLLMIVAGAATLFCDRDARASFLSKLRVNVAGVLACAGIAAAFVVEWLWLRGASQQMALTQNARAADGSVSFQTFLTWAGNTDLRSWNEMLTGLTPHLDFTFFAGFLVSGLLILACGSRAFTRAQRFFAWQIGILVFVATASPLATLTYFFWPFGRLFRHLGLLWPIVRLYAVFLAGATLEPLLSEPRESRLRMAAVVVMSVVFVGFGVILMEFALSPGELRGYLDAMTSPDLPVLSDYGKLATPRVVRDLVFLALSFGVLLALIGRRGIRRVDLGWAAAAVLTLDVTTYAWSEARVRSIQPSPREAELLHFTPLPYADRRLLNDQDHRNQRLAAFSKSAAKLFEGRYAAEDLFWLADGYQASGKTVYWSSAFDALLEARSGSHIDAYLAGSETLALPEGDPLLATIGALSAPKTRFFSRAIVCPDSASAAILLESRDDVGQMPVLTGATSLPDSVTRLPCELSSLEKSGVPVSAAGARIVGFASNHAEFDVNNPADVPLLMTYSDGWDRRWRARANGNDIPVFRSDLAYKAVVVPAGRSRLRFEYRDRMTVAVVALQTTGSLALIGLMGWIAVRRPD